MSLVTGISKIVFFFIDVSRFFKFKLFDKEETEILNLVEDSIEILFG